MLLHLTSCLHLHLHFCRHQISLSQLKVDLLTRRINLFRSSAGHSCSKSICFLERCRFHLEQGRSSFRPESGQETTLQQKILEQKFEETAKDEGQMEKHLINKFNMGNCKLHGKGTLYSANGRKTRTELPKLVLRDRILSIKFQFEGQSRLLSNNGSLTKHF